jgi:hypothetical protein
MWIHVIKLLLTKVINKNEYFCLKIWKCIKTPDLGKLMKNVYFCKCRMENKDHKVCFWSKTDSKISLRLDEELEGSLEELEIVTTCKNP